MTRAAAKAIFVWPAHQEATWTSAMPASALQLVQRRLNMLVMMTMLFLAFLQKLPRVHEQVG